MPSVHDADRYWDPFVAACDETGTVICMHSGSGSKMPSTSPDAPPAVSSTLTHELAEGSLADWLFSGLLVRYPNVTLTYSEGQIGWIPYILARADRVWEHNRGWSDSRDLVPEPPSTYYWGRIYGCFFDDAAGLAAIVLPRGVRVVLAGWQYGHPQELAVRHSNGGYGWVGPLFWPFAYFDIYDYALWGDRVSSPCSGTTAMTIFMPDFRPL